MANADNFRLDCILKINNNVQVSGCPRGGMVDTRDLKSLGLIGRASSSLAVGTRYFYNFPLKYGYNRVFLQKRNSKYVKKELFCVKTTWEEMREFGDDFGELDEDTEMQNLFVVYLFVY